MIKKGGISKKIVNISSFFAKSLEKTFIIYYNSEVFSKKIKINEFFHLKKFKKGQKMKEYAKYSKEELQREFEALSKKYDEYKNMGLHLDLSRGKPNSDQLDISLPLLSEARPREKCFSENGVDCRNYGVLDGIPEMKRLFAEMLGIKTEYISVGGNSSLQLMYGGLMGKPFVFFP